MKVMSARFRKCVVGASFFFLAVFSGPAIANVPWEAGERYALIVGINDYQNDSVTDLNCATSDAKLLKETLVKKGDFSEENIFLLTSDGTGESDRPSLTNIVFRLEWLREVVGPGDTLVFYFAGHGVSIDSETFLLTEEADQRSRGTLMISSLRGSVLNELLKSAGAQNTLVLLDACRNDPTAGRGDKSNTLSPTLARGLVFEPLPAAAQGLERNTATVFACSEGERSWEWGDKKQGFFTYFLAEALQKGAYDGDGNATLQGLVGYLREKVNSAAIREANQPQTPMLRYEGPGAERWILAKSDPTSPTNNLAVLNKAQLIARTEAAELEARRSKEALSIAQGEKVVAEAEKEILVKQDALKRAKDSGRDVKRAEDELEFAQDNLKLAREDQSANGQRAASTDNLFQRAKTQALAVDTAKTLYGLQEQNADVSALEKQLVELRGQVATSEKAAKTAVERAVRAEQQVAKLEMELAAKWEGRALGKRPTRRMRREDLWNVVNPGAEEADSL